MGYQVEYSDICFRCGVSTLAHISPETEELTEHGWPKVVTICPLCPNVCPTYTASYIHRWMDLGLIEAAWPGFTDKLAMDLVREGT
jgi:hypothetical protein